MQFFENFSLSTSFLFTVLGGIALVLFVLVFRLARHKRTFYDTRREAMAQRIHQTELQNHDYIKTISKREQLHLVAAALQDVLRLKYAFLPIAVIEEEHALYIQMPQTYLCVQYAPHAFCDFSANTEKAPCPWHIQEIYGQKLPDDKEESEKEKNLRKQTYTKNYEALHFATLPLLEAYILSRFQEHER